jgi:hypothetical protein
VELPNDEGFINKRKFKGKSRGVSLRSVLGEDGLKLLGKEKRNIQNEWFDYLDNVAFEAYATSRGSVVMPHKKLMTFGASTTSTANWQMCGNWVEGHRFIKMNEAGVKRQHCFGRDRATSLVMTKVMENKTPRALSAKHEPEWLGGDEEEVFMREEHENAELKLAHGWGEGF